MTWKRIGIAAGLLAAVLALVAFGLFPQDTVRSLLEARLSSALGGPVRMRAIHVVPAKLSAEIEGLSVDTPAYTLTADHVSLRSRVATLTSGAIDLESLEVVKPRIAVKPPQQASEATTPPAVRIDRLSLTDGSLEVPAQGVSVTAIEAQGSIGSEPLDLSLGRIAWRDPRPAEGRLRMRLRLTSGLEATVESAHFETAGLQVEAKGQLGPLTQPAPDLAVEARATLPEVLALAPATDLEASGRLTLSAQLRGTLEKPEAEGRIVAEALVVSGWSVASATAHGTYRTDVSVVDLEGRALNGTFTGRGELHGKEAVARLSLRQLDVPDVGRVSADATAQGPYQSGRMRLSATATVTGERDTMRYDVGGKASGAIAMPSHALDLAWTADANLAASSESAEAHARGTVKGPWPSTIEGTLDGEARLARETGPLVVPVNGTVRSQGAKARIDVAARPGDGRMNLGVDLEGGAPRRVTASGEALDLGLLDPSAGGRVSLELDLQDPLGRASGEGRAHAEALVWAGTPLGNADATLTASQGVYDARFDVPELHLSGTAQRAGATAPNITGTLRADKTPLGLLARGAGQPDVEGEASAEATFTVPVDAPAKATLQATISSVSVERGEYHAATEAPFRVDLDATRIAVDGFRAGGHGASLALDGSAATGASGPLDLRTRFSADLAKLPLAEGTTAHGLMAGELALSGRVERPAARGEITLADIAVASAGLPTIGIAKATARIDGETLTLPATDMQLAQGTLTVEGQVPVAAAWPKARARADAVAPSESARLDLRWANLSLAELAREAAPDATQSISGTTTGEAHVEGGLAAIEEVKGTAHLELAALRVNDLPLGVTPVELSFERARAEMPQVTMTAENASLVLAGSADFKTRTLDGSGKGNLDLRAISPFLPETAMTGKADVDLTLAGTFDAPKPLGRLDVTSATMRTRLFPHAVTGLGGAILFDAQGLHLDNVSAEMAGGTLTASGGSGIGKAGLENVNVKLEGRELNLRYPTGLRSRATLDLTLTGRTGKLLLAGDVKADRGRYDVDAVLRDAIRGTKVDKTPPPSPFLRSIALDVRVTTESPVVVRHEVVNVEASGSLTARGDAETPAPFGRFEILEGGTLEIQGHEFEVESGSLTYTGTWNPDVSLRLTSTIHSIDEQTDYDVIVTASGSLENPTLSFASEPATHSEAEVLSLISTGRLDTGATESVGRLAGNQLAILMTSRLTGGLARGLGLDRVSLQPELLSRDEDPGARFTFEKQLARRLRLIQSYSLNDAEARFTQIEADMPHDVKLLGQRDDDGVLTAGAGQKLRFGGPKKPKAPKRQRRAPLQSIVLEGAPAGQQDALRKVIKAKEGKRAGTNTLQDDAERIRLELVKRGYIEAEASVRLKDGVATFVARPGSHFSTRVEGAGVPKDLDKALLESLYEDEAFERGKALVLADLRDTGYLRATVRTEVEANGEERVLVFHAVPGKKYTAVTLQFPGSKELSEKALSKAGGGAAAFLVEPAAALERVRTAYGEALRLGAQAGPVDVQEGPDSVAITVPVDEGPPARLAALHMAGATEPEEELLAKSKLEIGAEYDEDEVIAGVTRVRERYLALGYPAIRVAPEVKIAAPDIDLTLRIDEGERMKVGAITIAGAERTRLGLVRSTLHFKEGDPLDPRELTKAERRLLELGVFTRASISYSREDPAKVTVDLQEQAPLFVSYQVRYNEEEHTSGQVDVERGNLFGRGLALGGRFKLGGTIEEERVSLHVPSLLHGDFITSLFRINEDLLIDENDPDSDTNNSLERGFELQQKTPLGDLTNLLVGYRYKRSTLTSPFLLEPITVTVAALESSLVRDSRDFALDASRGKFLSLSLEYAPESLGSDLRFFKSFGQAFLYKKLGESLVWGQAYRTGLAWTYGGQELIPDERFTAGGANSVRGYATDSLGPRDEFFGEPLGGEATIVMNQELRYRHKNGLGGVLFWDVGNVFAHVSDIKLDFKNSVGVGLRWASPVGLLRFDIGHALQPPPDEKSWRYYFSLGQSF